MPWLQQLAAELAITITNGEVWTAIGLALLLGAGCLAFGVWVARTVGLLGRNAPAGETLGVGLASGLMVVAAWWAAIWSGGRSSFTPVAVGSAIALVLALARRLGHPAIPDGAAEDDGATAARRPHHKSLALTTLASGVFVVAIALLYGATMAPSPRDGVQPVENRDEAFYAVLGRDLATTGIETNTLPSGFTDLPGVPAQIWYHWGELWLQSSVIAIFGTAPLPARFFIVLPIVLLAAAALSGTLVRRLATTNSSRAYAFGFLACLFLAPVPLIPGPFFSNWAVGMIFGITLYGLGAVAALLAIYCVAELSSRKESWALAGFVGAAVALILPAHVAVALLVLVGAGGVWTIRIIQTVVATRRLPIVLSVWARTLIAAAIAVIATVVWGVLTGHGTGSSPSSSATPSVGVSPFNASWRESIAVIVLGAGLFLAIPVAWLLRVEETLLQTDIYLGTMGLLVAGAIGWGARLADFTTFYLFFAGIAVFATPVAAIAARSLWARLRATRHGVMATGLLVVCLFQLELGVASGLARLQGFGSGDNEPIPVSLLRAINQLPADAKLAYSCGPFDEVAFGTPQLLSIDAHTRRRVVPMCFEAEFPSTLIGALRSEQVVSQFFQGAPQLALYPDAAARPSSTAVTAFLKDHGIGYIYADALHPNTLVPEAIPVASDGDFEVLRVP